MPLEFAIDGRVVKLVSNGSSNPDEVVNKLIELYTSPDFPAEPILYWDMRNSSSLGERNATDFGMIANKTSAYTQGVTFHSVFLVDNDLYHGMVRMMGAYGGAEAGSIAIFRTEQEVLKWIEEQLAS